MKRTGNHPSVFRFYTLKAGWPVFASEAKRHALLRALAENGRHQGYTLCAFSILDDAIYLLLYKNSRVYGQMPMPVEDLLRHGRSLLPQGFHLEEPTVLRENGTDKWGNTSAYKNPGEKNLLFREETGIYRAGGRRKAGREIQMREQDSGWTIYNAEEVLSLCYEIHIQPLREGYVTDVNDYWFSSWQSYRDYYIWTGLDIDPVLKLMKGRREKALQQFQKEQKDKKYQIIKKY